MELIQSEQEKEQRIKKKKRKACLRDLWDNIRWTDIHVIGVPEGEERDGQKTYLKNQ